MLLLLFSVLFTNFIWSQVTVNGYSSVEVAQNTPFGFVFSPTSKIPSVPTGEDPVVKYKLTSWFISSLSSNMNNSGQSNYSNNSQALTYYALNQSQSINFPIRWDDNSNQLTDTINIIVYVNFFDKNNNQIGGTVSYDITYPVNINRIFTPSINSPTILSCCTTPVTFSASNYGTANVFNWTVGGATYTGAGSSISVTPDSSNGAISVNCIVSRSSGSPSYSRSNSISINRTARTAVFTPNYSTIPPYDYICKGSGGLQMNMSAQCGISTINWVAPNCIISGQNTLTPTITPTNAIATGSSINIYADVSYTGGCTATTPSISFKILDSSVAPTPQGSFNVTLPANGSSICDTETFDLSFVSSNGFNNGVTTISPVFLWGPGNFHYKAGKPTTVTVSNINLCTGLSTSKTFNVYPPVPCASAKSFTTATLSTNLMISPNPTTGNTKAILPEILSGVYQIFDQSNTLVQEAKFNNQNELQIEFYQNVRSGIYILKVISENSTFSEKIILNK